MTLCTKGAHLYNSDGLCMKCGRESYRSRKQRRRVHAMLRDLDLGAGRRPGKSENRPKGDQMCKDTEHDYMPLQVKHVRQSNGGEETSTTSFVLACKKCGESKPL